MQQKALPDFQTRSFLLDVGIHRIVYLQQKINFSSVITLYYQIYTKAISCQCLQRNFKN